MNRPLLLAAFSVVSLATASALAETKRPNIVIVMPDDVGYGDFSVNGSPIVKTPHIDAFAPRASASPTSTSAPRVRRRVPPS